MDARTAKLAGQLEPVLRDGVKAILGDEQGNADLAADLEEIAVDVADAVLSPERWDDQALQDQVRLVLRRRADRASQKAVEVVGHVVRIVMGAAREGLLHGLGG